MTVRGQIRTSRSTRVIIPTMWQRDDDREETTTTAATRLTAMRATMTTMTITAATMMR